MFIRVTSLHSLQSWYSAKYVYNIAWSNHCVRNTPIENQGIIVKLSRSCSLVSISLHVKAVGLKAYRSKITTIMFVLKASLIVVLKINIDASAICQSYIFITNKFPKRFNSLFELRISVQNSLKNMYFLTIKLIVKRWCQDAGNAVSEARILNISGRCMPPDPLVVVWT
jgi:hypothetical protein